jgi:hypothetical protein
MRTHEGLFALCPVGAIGIDWAAGEGAPAGRRGRPKNVVFRHKPCVFAGAAAR